MWDYEVRPVPHELEIIGWFTSLWTLQEVCMRPDMVLLNKDFTPFTLANSWIVPFDSLVALVNGYLDSFGWLVSPERTESFGSSLWLLDRRREKHWIGYRKGRKPHFRILPFLPSPYLVVILLLEEPMLN